MGVTMIVEVKAKYTVQKKATVGIIRKCDMCRKVILDTTKIPDKFINDYPNGVYYYEGITVKGYPFINISI